MKRIAVGLLGLLALAGAAQAGGLPAPLSLVQREPTGTVHQEAYVRSGRKLPQPMSLVLRGPKVVHFTPFVRGYR